MADGRYFDRYHYRMADHVSEKKRSYIMSRVPSKNSRPEMAVRKALHERGLRYRLHRKDLPGTPDIVFPKQQVAIFVHGCFWHGHDGCAKSRLPTTRREYWAAKIGRNRERDWQAIATLNRLGWETEVIWQCEVKKTPRLIEFADTFVTRIKG